MTDPALARDAHGAPPPDEISLRDLYLVLRRRALLIVAGALVAGAAAWLVLGARPAAFVAESTSVVARAPIEVGLGSGLRFRPEVDITFDTYQTLAFSRGVLEQVLPSHEATDPARLREALTLEQVAGSANQTSGLLAVVHRVRSDDPGRAAAAATAWAAATVETARGLLLENLDAVEAITGEGLTNARVELEAAEAELEAFRASSGIDALRARLGEPSLGLEGKIDVAIAEVEAAARANRVQRVQRSAELDSLLGRRDEAGAATGGNGAAGNGAAGNGAAGLEVVLFAAPDVALSLEGAIASVDAQLAALEAESEVLDDELEGLRRERERAAAALADATVGLSRLQRAVTGPSQVVASLSDIEPTVAYVAQVVPSGARVLSEAVVPSAPESRQRGVVALLVAVVVGFAGIVLALLAEAVRDPRPAGDPGAARAAGAPNSARR